MEALFPGKSEADQLNRVFKVLFCYQGKLKKLCRINPFSASPPHRTYARSARLILRKLLVLI